MPPKINDTTYEVEMPSGDTVEIGDKDAPEFKPHIKLNRWNEECFIKVSLPTAEKPKPIIEGGKVRFEGRDIEAHFYPLEPRTVIAKDKDGKDVAFTQNELGGFEFEIILKKKPKTNKIVLTIETQGLRFCYQPELTPEEIAEGCVRPNNVVGSYAVYHAIRTPLHKSKADADKYRCGKAFHIYRPKITDANGDWVWGELSLDEQAGTLITTIPQDFLDGAVYPVSIDPDFGYTSIGESSSTYVADRIMGSRGTGAAGTGDSISVYCANPVGTDNFKGIVVKQSDLTIITNGITDPVAVTTLEGWRTGTFGTSPSIEAIDYYVSEIHDGSITVYFDSDQPAASGIIDFSNNYATPTDPTDAYFYTNKFSIYCTYTPAVAVGWQGKISGVTNPAKIAGVAVANIKSVKGVE